MTELELVDQLNELASVARSQGDQEVEKWFNSISHSLAKDLLEKTRQGNPSKSAANWLFDLHPVVYKEFVRKQLLGKTPEEQKVILNTIAGALNKIQELGKITPQAESKLRQVNQEFWHSIPKSEA